MISFSLNRLAGRLALAAAFLTSAIGSAGCSGAGGADGSTPTTPGSASSGTWTAEASLDWVPGGVGSTSPSAYVSTAPAVNAKDNFVTVREVDGVTTIDYPMQLGRTFLAGEIANHPQALVDGQGVETQANVKTRWSDGSVKHAVMSFYIPTLGANETKRITFTNQPNAPTAGLSDAQLLDARFNFDSALQISSNGSVARASARQMLAGGHAVRWLDGPVSTSIVLADHSTSRAFDLGFDSYRSLRPIFHATFWPRINKVFVRVIGETSNPDAWQTLNYDLTITGGASEGAVVYSKPGVSHHPASRWTRSFWIGTRPSRVNVDHNLKYLAATRAIPNYDTSVTLSESALQRLTKDWQAAPKGVLEAGNWEPGMGTAGGRPDIGPYPNWVVAWLYSGDHRAQEAALGNADLAGAWPMHLRESRAGRQFDPLTNADALGRPISVFARPSFVMSQSNVNIRHSIIQPQDAVQFIGSENRYNGWNPDAAHQPDPFSVAYLLTGEYWYLEQMHFWASWGTFLSVPGGAPWSRGPLSTSGGIFNEDRGEAWAFRNRVQTAWFSTDGSPERAYFERQVADAIAIWEGRKGISNGAFAGSREWQWAYEAASEDRSKYGISPLGAWIPGVESYANAPEYLPGTVKLAIAPWTHGFLFYALGRAKELGYQTDAILKWMSPFYTRMSEAGVPRMAYAGLYTIPSVSALTGRHFSSWEEIAAAYAPSIDALARFRGNLPDLDHGYSNIACAGATFVAREPGGAAAVEFCDSERPGRGDFSDNPKWALRPR